MESSIDVVTNFTANVQGLMGGAQQASGAFNDVAKSQETVGKTATGAVSGVKALGLAFRALVAVGVVKWLMGAVQSFEESERASLKLGDTLEKNSSMLSEGQQYWEDYASSIEDYTRFSDEAVTTTISMLGNLNLTATQVQQLTPLIADLAEKYNLDLQSATLRVTRALMGQGRSLQYMGIQMGDVKKGADNFGTVLEGLQNNVQGFAKSVEDTAAVAMAQLGNEFDNFKERVGQAVVPVLVAIVKYGLTPLAEIIQRIPTPMLAVGAAFGVIAAGAKVLAPVAGVVAKSFQLLFSTVTTAGTKALQLFGIGMEDSAVATESADAAMADFTGTTSNANTSIQSIVARMATFQSSTMAGATAQERLAAAVLTSTNATQRQADVTALNSLITQRAVLYQELGVEATEAQAIAANQVAVALDRQAAAQAAAASTGGKMVNAFKSAVGIIGAVGVAVAVATVAWTLFQTVMGAVQARAEETRARLAALRTAFVQADPSDQTQAFNEYAAALLETYDNLELVSRGNAEMAASMKIAADGPIAVGKGMNFAAQNARQAVEEQQDYNEALNTAREDAARYAAAQAQVEAAQEGLNQTTEQGVINMQGLANAQKTVLAESAKLAAGLSFMGMSVEEIVDPVFEAQSALIELESTARAVAEKSKDDFETMQKAMEGDLTAAQDLSEDGQKFIQDFAQAQTEMADAAVEAYNKMVEGITAWENDFASSINNTMDRFGELASEGNVSFQDLTKAMRDSQKEMMTFGNLSQRILRIGGKEARPFIQAMTEMGTDAIPIMTAALSRGKKGVEQIVGSFNRGQGAANSLADQLSKALLPALRGIAAGFKAMLEKAGIEVPRALERAAGASKKTKEATDAAADSAMVAKQKFAEYQNQLEKTPKTWSTKVEVDTASAAAELGAFIAAWTARTITMSVQTVISSHSGGPVMHAGGQVMHSGGLKSDERAAILQVGEFVFSKRAVSRWGTSLLKAMNDSGSRVGGVRQSIIGQSGERPVDLSIEVNPVFDRGRFVRTLDYSTRLTGR